ncbi:MAG: hypothetical protein ACREOG_23845 [Gemmatimonadaceae bacterium]
MPVARAWGSRGSALALVLACGACHDSAGIDFREFASAALGVPAAFQTDLPAYSLRLTPTGYEGAIGVTFTNPTSNAVYIVNCQGGTSLHLDKLVGSRWIVAYAPVVLDCLSAPIVIQKGAQYRSVVGIYAGYPGTNFHPKFTVSEISGIYRIVWSDVVRTYDQQRGAWSDPLPEPLRTSNWFTIAAAAR